MRISNNYIVVERIEQPKKEGEFEVKSAVDSFMYTGKVVEIPEAPVYMGNTPIVVGDAIIFAKYSPDTHDSTFDGKPVKFVSTRDILAVL